MFILRLVDRGTCPWGCKPAYVAGGIHLPRCIFHLPAGNIGGMTSQCGNSPRNVKIILLSHILHDWQGYPTLKIPKKKTDFSQSVSALNGDIEGMHYFQAN